MNIINHNKTFNLSQSVIENFIISGSLFAYRICYFVWRFMICINIHGLNMSYDFCPFLAFYHVLVQLVFSYMCFAVLVLLLTLFSYECITSSPNLCLSFLLFFSQLYYFVCILSCTTLRCCKVHVRISRIFLSNLFIYLYILY